MDNSIFDPIFQTFEQFSAALLEYLPTLLFALVVVAAGLAVAWALKALMLRIGAALAPLFRRFTQETSGGTMRLPLPVSTVSANIVYWLAVAFFVAVAARILGLPGIAEWLAAAAAYLPKLVAAVAILFFGYLAAVLVRDWVTAFGEFATDQRRSPLGLMAFYLINLIAILAALRHLGIDLVLVRSLILIGFAALFGAIALAFGLGARGSLDNLIAGYYARKLYQRGHRLRVGALEGDVIDVTPTTLVLATANGRAIIPAHKFNEDISILLGSEETGNER